ncbi:MAG: hypothetical protein A2946_02970 [Candidatus Liptonbacteria bacterium RIFCSPLOWO2_01_FULL_53_13]|uniref:Uncharacterized protein n=1 Tax=Candidatus Liptonbacteria bacterium RIFCSPLOWO2_01_FULL_53_13 TaxID=1798651 RepID=A0A1G2CM88_9BACT|nr:MAG: hypothetical protein A2946_02970 [Candidatus Liptonbacteria bacterium RIFCSPLOWO2_01_FULL_53_13]
MERPPSPEDIKLRIEALFIELKKYAIEQFPEELQEQLDYEWYAAVEGAKNCKEENRGEALEYLHWYVDKLSRTPKKK